MIGFPATTHMPGRTRLAGLHLSGRTGTASVGRPAVASAWANCVLRMERDEWVTRYFEILVRGYAAQPPAVEAEARKRRGRQKQSVAKNLLDDIVSVTM
jgi:hypothetical protein